MPKSEMLLFVGSVSCIFKLKVFQMPNSIFTCLLTFFLFSVSVSCQPAELIKSLLNGNDPVVPIESLQQTINPGKMLLPNRPPSAIAANTAGNWYNTYWFMLAVLLLAIALIYLIIKIRIIHLKRINKQLEEIVSTRTSELVAQREKLQSVNKDLRTINKELDNFVYRSSHDLVAPLKSLKGLIHLAKIDNPGEQQLYYLQVMDTSVTRLEDFIKSIMNYSIHAKRKVEFQEVEFDGIINEIISELQYFEKANEVEIKKEYDRDFIVKTDPSRLKIVLSNLITNSIKYHNYDQPKPCVKIFARHEKGQNIIKVIDNGAGIPDEYLSKIFDMFFRASESAEGSGLGLYIVKDTINKLRGKIEVESEVGSGTTFTIKL